MSPLDDGPGLHAAADPDSGWGEVEAALADPAPAAGADGRIDPSELVELTRAAFDPHGALSRAADAFLPRAGQTAMAVAVARTIATGGALVGGIL